MDRVRLGVRLRQLQHALGVDEVDILGARIVQQLLERVTAHLVRARVRRAADARVSVLLQYLVPELDPVVDVEGQLVARQPEAADKITGAVNLPLFLLEGVAILAEVFAFLMLVL